MQENYTSSSKILLLSSMAHPVLSLQLLGGGEDQFEKLYFIVHQTI